MTKEQGSAKMKCRLSKYVLQVLLEADVITTENAVKARGVIGKVQSLHLLFGKGGCMAERIVTLVKPKRKRLSFTELILQKRVAAYARVSMDSDEQLNSIAAQKRCFERFT